MKIKDLADLQEVLQGLTEYRVVIAGGAVRDTLFGKPVKDVDVFVVRSREEDDFSEAPQKYVARRIAKLLNATIETTSEQAYVGNDEEVYATYDLELSDKEYPDLPRVNLIFVQDLERALNEFPDTISQVYLDEEGEPVYSDTFRDALVGNENQVFTRLPPDNRRVQRLQEKYGSMRWVQVPDNDPRLEWA